MCLGVPGKIISISETSQNDARLAKVEFSGVTQNVRLDFVPEAQIGNYVLVHVGVALRVIDEDEAQKTLEMLEILEPKPEE